MTTRMKANLVSLIVIWVAVSCTGLSENYSTEITSVKNGDVALVAKIYRPKGNGPFPAIVLVHGSKNHTKEFYSEYSEYFASHGIVSVNYDKRGHGQSTGNLYTSTFTDMAKDAIAIVDHLKSQSYINQDRIGLWADSQGGWVILMTESLSDDIDFMINKSGPIMTPIEQILFDYKHNYMIPDHTPQEVMDELGIWYKNVFEYLTRERSDSLWGNIESVIKKYENTPYLKNQFDIYYLNILGPPGTIKPKAEVILDPAGRSYDFDPVPYLKNLETPMLYFIGTADKLNNVTECIEALTKVSNPNITLKVYQGADHGIRIQKEPAIFYKSSFPQGYLQTQESFIKSGHIN